MTIRLEVVHNVHKSARTFEDVVEAFMEATGDAEEGADAIARGLGSREEFEAEFSAREGPSGFMRFSVVDHGDWLTRFYGKPVKALLANIGNPLVAITMLEQDLESGLNVPTRIYIQGEADGKARVTYDLPSTLMGNLTERTREAAGKLDDKMVELATSISGTGPTA